MRKTALLLSSLLCISTLSIAQVITSEDSLHLGLLASNNKTVLSGYGQVKVEYDARYKTGNANLTRNVLFLGHKFSNRISFFSELELEDARVVGGQPSGEISMEQLFLKFGLNHDVYFTAGLFIPRLGIINENHLPTSFNGNDRPYVETFLLPATWREVGIGVYARIRKIPGLNLSAALVNGLNSQQFGHNNGIVNGRFEGGNASASNLALTGAALYYRNGFRVQASAYYGGSAGLTKRIADSLQLNNGAFGTPVFLTEANVQYQGNSGFEFKVMGTICNIPEAGSINRAYANNTPSQMWGAYAEVGYNLLKAFNPATERSLVVFVRGESMDLNSKLSTYAISNGIQKKNYLVGGITYTPVRGVVIKADYVQRYTGEPNLALTLLPYPSALPYFTSNGFFNLGVGYSF